MFPNIYLSFRPSCRSRPTQGATAVTATVEKTWPKNGHFRDGDYFAISTSCLHSILFTNYPKNGLVGVA